MKVALKLPRLSMNMVECTIAQWHKQVGDSVAEGEAIFSVETEKVTSEVPSPAKGRMVEIVAPEGSELEVGDTTCILEIER